MGLKDWVVQGPVPGKEVYCLGFSGENSIFAADWFRRDPPGLMD